MQHVCSLHCHPPWSGIIVKFKPAPTQPTITFWPSSFPNERQYHHLNPPPQNIMQIEMQPSPHPKTPHHTAPAIPLFCYCKCWDIYSIQGINGDGQTNARSIQNCEEEDGEIEAKEGRIELSLLILNLGVQWCILSVCVCWLAHRWWKTLPWLGVNPKASALSPPRGCS